MKYFIDTSFIQAFLNKKDQNHTKAIENFKRVISAKEVWIHEGIFIELANAFSVIDKNIAAVWIQSCWENLDDSNIHLVSLDNGLVRNSFENYYLKYKDKTWGLMDCISFTVMKNNNIKIAFTFDRDFIQAGFKTIPE